MLVDLVKIYSLNSGSGAIKLGSAVPGYRGVEALSDGQTYSYSIQQDSNWEYGVATYLASQGVFVRSPRGSSAGGVTINITAGATIALVLLAEDLAMLTGLVSPINFDALKAEIARAVSAETFLSHSIVAATLGIQEYPDVTTMNADTTQKVGTFALVTSTGAFYRYTTSGWVADTAFANALASFIQPLVNQATTAATSASASAALVTNTVNPIVATYKGTAVELTPAGNLAEIDDADGRMPIAFGPDGNLTRSNQFVATIIAQAGVDGTAAAVARLPRVARLLSSTMLWGYTGSGQSNMSSAAPPPALTTTQPFNNVRVLSDGSAFTPLIETNAESCISILGNSVVARVRDLTPPWQSVPFRMVGNNMGQGGAPYSALKQGTPAYNAGLQKVSQAKALATAAGLTYAEMWMPNAHGETDAANGVSRATYAGYPPEWKNNWNTDVAAVTGQTNRIPMGIIQKSVSAGAEGASSTTLAQLDAAEADPEIFIVAPGYIADSADGLHYINTSQDLFGEYQAKAMYRYWVQQRSPSTVRPISLQRLDSRTIRVTFFVPVLPLVWDTDRVWPIDQGLGFAIRNNADGSTVQLARSPIILPSGYEIDITVAADLPAAVTVAYATTLPTVNVTGGYGLGRTVGPRGNLRDSDTTPAMFLLDASGRGPSLPNWCAIFEKVI